MVGLWSRSGGGGVVALWGGRSLNTVGAHVGRGRGYVGIWRRYEIDIVDNPIQMGKGVGVLQGL